MFSNILVSARNARFCICDSPERCYTRLSIVGILKAGIARAVTADLFAARVKSEDPPLVSPIHYRLVQVGVSSSSGVWMNSPENDKRSHV